MKSKLRSLSNVRACMYCQWVTRNDIKFCFWTRCTRARRILTRFVSTVGFSLWVLVWEGPFQTYCRKWWGRKFTWLVFASHLTFRGLRLWFFWSTILEWSLCLQGCFFWGAHWVIALHFWFFLRWHWWSILISLPDSRRISYIRQFYLTTTME